MIGVAVETRKSIVASFCCPLAVDTQPLELNSSPLLPVDGNANTLTADAGTGVAPPWAVGE